MGSPSKGGKGGGKGGKGGKGDGGKGKGGKAGGKGKGGGKGGKGGKGKGGKGGMKAGAKVEPVDKEREGSADKRQRREEPAREAEAGGHAAPGGGVAEQCFACTP